MPTTNPVPSTDPSDMLFNAGKLDEVVNGTANSFTDRLGVARRTVAGMNADFDAQLADAESDLNVYRDDAAASAAEALGYLQTIRATSYGAYASDPATDPLGNPPTVGDEYFNTTANLLKRWNGTTWQASDINTANLAASSGSSLIGHDGGTVQDVLDAVTGPNGAASVGYTSAGTGAVATTVQEQLRRESVHAVNHGADPTGVADSTAAIVAALATGKDVKLTDGTYKLSPTAVQTISNQGYQRLYGEGNVTLSVNLASSIDLFLFNGPVALENLTIDFNNSYARHSFRWAANAGHINIKNIRVKNLKDIDGTTGSSTFWVIGDGNVFDISNVTAASMLKRGNGVVGDTGGSYNLIYVTGDTYVTGSIKNIKFEEIHNINSSDAIIYEDAGLIYVATSLGNANDSKNSVTISNITGINYGKRIVKAQASNVRVTDVYARSDYRDTYGAIDFQANSSSVGEKIGCSAENITVLGYAEFAVACSANNSSLKNIFCRTTPFYPANASYIGAGVFVDGDDIQLDHAYIDAQFGILIGGSRKVNNNLSLENITLNVSATADRNYVTTISSASGNAGFANLRMSNISAVVDNLTAELGVLNLSTGLNSTVRANGVTIENFSVTSAKVSTSFTAALILNCDNLIIKNLSYNNISGTAAYEAAYIEACKNVVVDGVHVLGDLARAVELKDCTRKATVSNVYAQNATSADVYVRNVENFFADKCNQSKVSGITLPVWQGAKVLTGTTAARPTDGLISGYTQYFDTTLQKPIWWNGSVWKDATGATV